MRGESGPRRYVGRPNLLTQPLFAATEGSRFAAQLVEHMDMSRFKLRIAEGAAVSAGRVAQGGKISCGCGECQGDLVSLLEFEEHAGAGERYQTECVHLTRHNLTLKVTASGILIIK